MSITSYALCKGLGGIGKKPCIRYYDAPASSGKAGCTFKHIIVLNSIKITGALHLKIEPQPALPSRQEWR